MFRAMVDQKATTPVSDGTKKAKNSPKVLNFDGADSIGPKPPAFTYAQPSNASPISSRKGALMPCRKRMVSMPRTITYTFSSQNKPKQSGPPSQNSLQPGTTAASRAFMAAPPIQV